MLNCKMDICIKGFAVMGASVSTYYLLKWTKKLFHAVRVFGIPSYPNFSKYGSWSVVTGSTDGIGKSIAFQLAARGQNIILIARNENKLQAVAQEIVAKHNVKVEILKIDFSDDESIYGEIERCLASKDIGVLVNNVGMSPPINDFIDMPNLSLHLRNISRVNMFSMFKMHQIVLPGMVERRRGLIMNIGSSGSLLPIMPVYGSTKAFVDYFSLAMSYEYEDKGIIIQSCLPNLVNTNMTSKSPAAASAIGPDAYAKSLLGTVEKERKTYGCFRHSFEAWFLRNIPMSIIVWMWKRSTAGKIAQMKKE